MQRISLNRDWDFYESNESNSFVFGSPPGTKVNLPHDFIIGKPRSPQAAGGAANGYFADGQGVYKKNLDAEPNWQGKTVLLDIDGAYMNTEIMLNQEVLAIHPNGYIPFQVDLTSALRFDGGANKLKIITQSRQPSSRWYSGGGLYRSVDLWVGGPVHVRPWDLFITTPHVSKESATVQVQATVTGGGKKEGIRLHCEIWNAAGDTVSDIKLDGFVETTADFCLTLPVQSPALWDLDTPNLYSCRLTVLQGEEILDTAEDCFGIRSLSADAENGFLLNGKPLKLKGGCIHHDNGFLGACAYPKAEERKIRLLQKAGYNTVRISHYPPSRVMLRICDKLGMLLMDEAFDVWRIGKIPMDYHQHFEAWWERDIENMVRRDRNHPSVITYSIGNEISESNGRNNGAAWSKKLADKVRTLDTTRPVLSALCAVPADADMEGGNFAVNMQKNNTAWIEQTAAYCEPLDIVGYNYLKDIYEASHERFPERVILATETHSFNTYDYWQKVEQLPYVLGDCIWAAVDYMGEVGVGKVYWENDRENFSFMGPYPWRTSWQSDIDLTGEQRPQSVYREIMWGNRQKSGLFTTHPKHFGESFTGTGWHWYDVNDSWTFPEEYCGKPVKTDVYGAGDEAEFLLNGKSLGRAPFDKLTATMEIPYKPGRLEAVVYENGTELSRCALTTAGKAASLELIPEEPSVVADGTDLCYVRVILRDAEGNRLTDGEAEITAAVTGCGEFVSMGSANPCTEDQITASRCHLHRGTAVIIIKGTEPGTVNLRVTAEGVTAGECSIQAV